MSPAKPDPPGHPPCPPPAGQDPEGCCPSAEANPWEGDQLPWPQAGSPALEQHPLAGPALRAESEEEVGALQPPGTSQGEAKKPSELAAPRSNGPQCL